MGHYDFQQLLFIVIAPACAVFLVMLLARILPNFSEPSNKAFIFLVLTDMGWLVCNWLEALWPTREGVVLLMQSAYVFIALLPVAWLEYSVRVAGRSPRHAGLRIVALSIIPLVTSVLAFTNAQHNFLWSKLSFSSVLGLPYVHASFGPWFWVHAVYSYVLVAVGALLVLDAYRGLSRNMKQQAWLSVVAVLLPLAYNIMFVTGFLPFIQKDYTSIIFALSAALFAYGSDRLGLFSILPIARSALFDSLKTALFVLNTGGRVLDANKAARDLIGGENPVGKLAGEFKPLELVARSLQKQGQWEADIAVDTPYGRRPHELSCMPIRDSKGRRIGVIVNLHDVAVRYELFKETSSLVTAAIRDPLATADKSLPICSGCGKARGKDNAWAPLAQVLMERYGIQSTHGLCPDCLPRYSSGGGEKPTSLR